MKKKKNPDFRVHSSLILPSIDDDEFVAYKKAIHEKKSEILSLKKRGGGTRFCQYIIGNTGKTWYPLSHDFQLKCQSC